MKTFVPSVVLALVIIASVVRFPSATVSAAPPVPPSGFEVVDLITNPDYEDPAALVGFETWSGTNLDGEITRTTIDPIAGGASLQLAINPYGRLVHFHDFGWESGRFVDSVVFDAKVRIQGNAAGSGNAQACAIVYFHNDNEPLSTCQTMPAAPQSVVDLSLTVDTDNREVRYVFAQFTHANDNTTITLMIDDVHLYVVEPISGGTPVPTPISTSTPTSTPDPNATATPTPSPTATPTPMPPLPGNGGMGEYPSSQNGRHVLMISPSNGETFVTPLNLRLVASGYDNLVYTNDPLPGLGTNAAKVQWFLDHTLIFEQNGSDAEYRVFKGVVNNLDVQPGTYRVWARAIYVNPSLILDSQPFTITVQQAPEYAQTIALTQNITLSASNPSYHLDGTAGRIRLNGNCHTITGTGTLTLRHVDVYNLGSCTDPAAPGIDVASTTAITIESVTVDFSNRLDLTFNGAATASIRNTTFRSNMRMPIGQQPYEPETMPVITISGASASSKVFAGNRVGAGPIYFTNANNWLIGGSINADSNILIGPRTGLVINTSANITVRGNFLHHVYDGGWSQGELFEVHGTSPILVEHNVFRGSSWPVRGIAGEFRYNLVANGGHTWIVPGENAQIHHNVFVACYDDGTGCNWGGIASLYDVDNVRIDNNTFDATGSQLRAAIGIDKGQATIRSNAFFSIPNSGGSATVDILPAASVSADYNGFYNTRAINYSNAITPPHDLNGGAQTNPQFAGPNGTVTFDEHGVWTGAVTVSDLLSEYRARYTPTQGSPYIDAGDPAGGAGNDIGAIGAGVVNANDQFGSFGQDGWTPLLDGGGNTNQRPDPNMIDPGFTDNLRAARPFIELADSTAIPTSNYGRFKPQ